MNMITFLKEEFKVFNLLKTNSFNRLSVNVYFLHFSSFFCFLLFLLPAISIAQKNKPDTLYADFISQKIKRDGILNEEVWQKAHRISNFQQREPEEGKPVSEKTEVAFLYNDNTLYIGLWGFDSHPEKILAKDMARDGRWGTSDNFEIVISTFNDNRNAYLFVVNPN